MNLRGHQVLKFDTPQVKFELLFKGELLWWSSKFSHTIVTVIFKIYIFNSPYV
jgi:hypothetical protein